MTDARIGHRCACTPCMDSTNSWLPLPLQHSAEWSYGSGPLRARWFPPPQWEGKMGKRNVVVLCPEVSTFLSFFFFIPKSEEHSIYYFCAPQQHFQPNFTILSDWSCTPYAHWIINKVSNCWDKSGRTFSCFYVMIQGKGWIAFLSAVLIQVVAVVWPASSQF